MRGVRYWLEECRNGYINVLYKLMITQFLKVWKMLLSWVKKICKWF